MGNSENDVGIMDTPVLFIFSLAIRPIKTH